VLCVLWQYDYDAPVDEYGVPHDPKYSHLSEAHAVLNTYAAALLSGPFAPAQDLGNNCRSYTYNVSVTPVVFVANTDATSPCNVSVADASFTVPAWSISAIDLTTLSVRYNSHTLSTKTQSAAEAYSKAIAKPLSSWSPQAEDVRLWVDRPAPWPGAAQIVQTGPAEQLTATQYQSMYFWYCVNFTTSQSSDSVELKLSNIGDYFYVFIDSSDAPLLVSGGVVSITTFTLKTPGLSAGTHTLQIVNSLLGVNNVAFSSNYFDRKGLQGSLIVNQRDLTNTSFVHVVGIQGEALQLYNPLNRDKVRWSAYNASSSSSSRQLGGTWLQVRMPTPSVVGDMATSTWQFDLSAMVKGHLYVNGFFLGPYWNVVAQTGCGTCEYDGGYDPERCRYDCGKPSQSLYQLPRDVLNPEGQDNYVVLFEEQGGDPCKISFNQRN
jgi:beta-galactosidase